jgi:hypothetical protein
MRKYGSLAVQTIRPCATIETAGVAEAWDRHRPRRRTISNRPPDHSDYRILRLRGARHDSACARSSGTGRPSPPRIAPGFRKRDMNPAKNKVWDSRPESRSCFAGDSFDGLGARDEQDADHRPCGRLSGQSFLPARPSRQRGRIGHARGREQSARTARRTLAGLEPALFLVQLHQYHKQFVR